MKPDRLVTVYKLSDPVKAELIKTTLLNHGLACDLDGVHQAGFAGVFEIGVLVRDKDIQRARDIIEKHRFDKSLAR